MVARGDLGVEMSPKNAGHPELIIAKACEARLPVITATQMLESMTQNPRPTRAEASDVANAVFDGSDALMLSAETAAGAYPVQAVEMMDRIIREAEASDSQVLRPAPAQFNIAETSAELILPRFGRIAYEGHCRIHRDRLNGPPDSKHRRRPPIIAFSTIQETPAQTLALLGRGAANDREVQNIEELVLVTREASARRASCQAR